MPKKTLISGVIVAVFSLVSLLLLQSCGKNPVAMITGGVSVNVGVGKVPNVAYSSPKFYAPGTVYKAYESSNAAKVMMYITKINLIKDNGSTVVLFENNAGYGVDLAQGTNDLTALATLGGNVPAGTYKGVELGFLNTYTINGQVTVGGVTYYTKNNSTGYSTAAPAEDISVKLYEQAEGAFSSEITPVTIQGPTTFKLYIDLTNFLAFSDGVSPTADMVDWFTNGSSGFGLVGPLAAALTVGEPGSMEVYSFNGGSDLDQGRIVLLFDSADKFIGGCAKRRVSSTKGFPSPLHNGDDIKYFTSNGNGTYNLGLATDFGTKTWNMTEFRRADHSGPYSGSGQSGTYTTHKIP